MAKKILVTGAGGYIGRHVVKALLDSGLEVVASDLRVDGIDDRATKIQANIFEPNDSLFEELGSPDVCLHMAWRDGFKHNSDNHMGDLSSHYRFIKTMLDAGLKQIAVMGTMHEVGYWEGAIDESTPCHPASMYGIAKNALREATLMLAKEKDATVQWIRAYYIVGDDAHGSSIFSKLLQAANEGSQHSRLLQERTSTISLMWMSLHVRLVLLFLRIRLTGLSIAAQVSHLLWLNEWNVTSRRMASTLSLSTAHSRIDRMTLRVCGATRLKFGRF